jgi:lipopolysaccharide transport system ATP-binding protein
MSDVAIKVDHLSKLYRIGARGNRHDMLRDQIVHGIRHIFQRNGKPSTGGSSSVNSDLSLWALKDVSFEVKRGDVVGFVGRNGAGKSTLLKTLSRITEPTSGRAQIYGRVGSLLEVGTGFHSELTGRENIYLNGAILGMKKVEIERKFDEIVAFSEIEKFIDTPVKRYSSGMYVRLAFAVAAHLEPEILIVDEVLAVGDTEFQRKCLGKMEAVGQEGRTVLFVSHNITAVQKLCNKSVLLDSGELLAYGDTEAVTLTYMRSVKAKLEENIADRTDRQGSGEARFTDMEVIDESGKRCVQMASGQCYEIRLKYKCKTPIAKAVAAIGFLDPSGIPLFQLNTAVSGYPLALQPPGGQLVCKIRKLPLNEGTYQINLALADARLTKNFDHLQAASYIDVIHHNFFGTGTSLHPSVGPLLVDHCWID